eukprot:scaffold20383_cov82-Skeletonema_marinoi.AAC.2
MQQRGMHIWSFIGGVCVRHGKSKMKHKPKPQGTMNDDDDDDVLITSNAKEKCAYGAKVKLCNYEGCTNQAQ